MTSGANPWEHAQLLPSPLCTDSLGRLVTRYQSIWGWGKEGRGGIRKKLSFKINLKRVTFKMSQHIIRNIYKMLTLPCVYEDIVWKRKVRDSLRCPPAPALRAAGSPTPQ